VAGDRVSSPADAHEVEAARFGDAFAAGGGAPVVEAAPAVVHREPDEKKLRQQLAVRGYADVSDSDVKQLLELYPDGVTFGTENMIASVASAKSASARRVPMSTVTGSSGVVTYLLPVGGGDRGPGRSILVQPRGGGAIILDAGGYVGGPSSAIAQLVRSGLASGPGQLRLSHADKDHIADVQNVIENSGMPVPSILIAKQLLAHYPTAHALEQSNVHLFADRCVEIDVTGEGVHIRKEIRGTTEVIELRLVSAHGEKELDKAENRNATSPVTIIRDLVTGTTQFFVADAGPKTIMEIANWLHPSVLAELLGSVGLVELPHHGGNVKKGAELKAFVEMLRMLYRASNGRTVFFAAASVEMEAESFPIFKALIAAGLSVAIVKKDAQTAMADHPIVAFKDGKLVTIGKDADGNRVEMEHAAQGGQDTLMKARRAELQVQEQRDKLRELIAEAEAGGDVLVAAALKSLDKKLEDALEHIGTGVNEWLDGFYKGVRKAENAASFDPTACQAALEKIEKAPVIAEPETGPLGVVRRTIDSYEARANALESYHNLSESMVEAALRGELEEVLATRALVSNARADVTKALTPQGIYESVAKAYANDAKEVPKLDSASGRLGEAMAKATIYVTPEGAPRRLTQSELTKMIEDAHGWGMNPSFGGSGRMRPIARGAARGVGALGAIIELCNTIEGLVHAFEELSRQSKIASGKAAIRDRAMLDWWLSHGATPRIQLLGSGELEALDNDACWKIVRGVGVTTKDKKSYYDEIELPDDMRVVVTDVTDEEARIAAAMLIVTSRDLDAFHQGMSDKRYEMNIDGKTPFLLEGDVWCVLLWTNGKYQAMPFLGLSKFLKDAIAQLKKEKQDELDKGTPTGWAATCVYVYVHREGEADHIDPLDTDKVNPMPQRIELPFEGHFAFKAFRGEADDFVASDAQTFDELRKYWWWDGETRLAWSPTGRQYDQKIFKQNVNGMAILKKKDVRAIAITPKTTPAAEPKGLPEGAGDYPDGPYNIPT
jgi:hypothetical protein